MPAVPARPGVASSGLATSTPDTAGVVAETTGTKTPVVLAPEFMVMTVPPELTGAVQPRLRDDPAMPN
ncbi:hypothetical protein [Mycobacterium sherrisii]|uniref:hypothetical protein n=1 Tax=Mycobacterium sherrisii TaxID=243061 RepID=UPI001153C0A4|nr:hypothetical protein [Mycobacterium sherrisii]MCV7031325.1 hypothetical protein [Mycobacterium sherrisii]MEC4764459.1 hypothetical protein [Mycobacterium sherrisii]